MFKSMASELKFFENIIDGRGISALEDLLPGGPGDDRPDEDFDAAELAKGIADEMEHTYNADVAKEIAKDHLTMDPHYYSNMGEGAVTQLGYADIKGKHPGDKDYQRMYDLKDKAGGSESKLLALAQNMARAIGRGSDGSSREKAHRRAKAAADVFPGKVGKQIAQMFMDAAEVKFIPRASSSFESKSDLVELRPDNWQDKVVKNPKTGRMVKVRSLDAADQARYRPQGKTKTGKTFTADASHDENRGFTQHDHQDAANHFSNKALDATMRGDKAAADAHRQSADHHMSKAADRKAYDRGSFKGNGKKESKELNPGAWPSSNLT